MSQAVWTADAGAIADSAELAKKCDEGRLMDVQLPEMGKAVDAVLKCKVRKHE